MLYEVITKPLHDGSPVMAAFIAIMSGWVTVIVKLSVHELASVTTMVYVPASRPDKVCGPEPALFADPETEPLSHV